MGLVRRLGRRLRDRLKGVASAPPVEPAPRPPVAPASTDTSRPWYLDGDTEGWDETNPGDDWRERLEE